MQCLTLTAGLSVLLCSGLRKPDSGLTEPIFQGQKCNSSWMSVWHFFFLFFLSKQLRTQWHRHETSQGSNGLISKLRRAADWVVLAAALPVTRKPRADSHRQLSTLQLSKEMTNENHFTNLLLPVFMVVSVNGTYEFWLWRLNEAINWRLVHVSNLFFFNDAMQMNPSLVIGIFQVFHFHLFWMCDLSVTNSLQLGQN